MIKYVFKKITVVLFLFLISSLVVFGQATSDVYYQWGGKLYAQGNYDLSLKYYRAAVQVDPRNWKAYQALGSCEYHLGMKAEAVRDFNQSLALNPNNPELQNFVNRISNEPAALPAPYQQNQPKVNTSNHLPKPGSVSWTFGTAIDLLSNQDIGNDFAPDVVSFSSEPSGAEFHFGADFTLLPSLQLGAQIQYVVKEQESIYGPVGDPFDDIFTESCAGLVADGKYLLPLSDQFRLIFEGQAGFYSLVNTTVEFGGNTGEEGEGTYNLNGSAVGELIGVEIEWVLENGGWAIDLGLGYRALSFDSITYTNVNARSGTSSSSQTLMNNSGGNFILDFSGPRIDGAVRFF